jgi:hypothetical protein
MNKFPFLIALWFAEAAGGIFCSPNDLVKFYRMIANKGALCLLKHTTKIIR